MSCPGLSERPLIDVGRGVAAAKRETLWDGHIAAWLIVGRLYRCRTLWTISTHVEDVPPEEMQKRMEAFCKQQGGA